MKIILQKDSGRYGFKVVSDCNRTVYTSSKHFFLTPFVQSDYKYAWEACRDAWRLARKNAYHIHELRLSMYDMEEPVTTDISAEEMITSHYLNIYRDLRMKAKGGGTPEERKNTYKEVAQVIKEIGMIQKQITEPKEKLKVAKILKRYELLVSKYFLKEKSEEEKLAPKVASVVEPECEQEVDAEMLSSLLDSYAEKVCHAIQHRHQDAYYGVSPDTSEITIYNFSNTPFLKVKINDYFNVESIIPVGELSETCPVHSVAFYQGYWKPITENIGHFCLGNPPVLVAVDGVTLPDVPKANQSFAMEGWNCKNRDYEVLNLSFKGETPIWIFEASQQIKTASNQQGVSQHTQDEYLNSKVKCVDPKLQSIYNKEGIVTQVLPMTDRILVEVQFPENLGIVRLTEPQIQIVPLGA